MQLQHLLQQAMKVNNFVAILNRLMSIIKAKTNSALDEIEDLREILELSLAETKEQLIKIKQSLVQVTTVKKKFEAEFSDIEGKIKLLEEQAEMAVMSQREDLAKEALDRKYSFMEKQNSIKNNILELNNKCY
jgi:phage shock protein A